MKILLVLATAGAIAALVTLATFEGFRMTLAPHQYAVQRVQATFKTPEEETKRTAQAKALDEPVFESLYKTIGSEKVAVYLPPKDSAAYSVLGIFATLLQASHPAAKEDLLPAPPAPTAASYIDDSVNYPMQVKSVGVFINSFQIGATVAFFVCITIAFLLRRRYRRTAAPSA